MFERLKNVSVAEGYRFDGIDTAGQVTVQWSLDGTPCPTIVADFGPCTSPSAIPALQLHVPADLLTRCPGLSQVVEELSHAVRAEEPAALSKPLADASHPPAVWPKAAALLLFAGFVVVRYLQASEDDGTGGWRGVRQIIFALVAANVLLLRTRDLVDAQLIAAWLVFPFLLIDRDRWPREPPTKLVLFALFLFSLLLHAALSHGGPGDAHLNLSSLWSGDLDTRWGEAPIALLRGVQLLTGPVLDTHIVWCNLMLSGLVPLLLYGMVRELGFGRAAATISALIAAAHPLVIVFSGVLERQSMYLFAAAGSLLALIRFIERDDWARFAAFVLGTILAMTCRPEGAHVIVLQIAAALLLPASRRVRGVALLTIAVLGMIGFVYARQFATSAPPSRTFAELINPASFLWTVLLDPDFTPAAWIVMWLLGVLLGLRRRAGWIVAMSLFGLHVLWHWTSVYEMFVGAERQVASTRYETILLIPFTLGIAAFVENVAAIRSAAKWGLAGIALAATVSTFPRTYDVLLRPFTIDHEYQFLRRHALSLPTSSAVWIFVSHDPDQGLFDAVWVGKFAGSDVQFHNWPYDESRCRDSLGKDVQDYLYIGSSCAEIVTPGRKPTREHELWMRDCELMRSRVAENPIEEIDVPARKFTWHEFAEPTVRLSLYRIRDASICSAGLSPLRHYIPASR